jgi:hypothetical protein
LVQIRAKRTINARFFFVTAYIALRGHCGRQGPSEASYNLVCKNSSVRGVSLIVFPGGSSPRPRFLASLGALSLVGLDHCPVVDLLSSPRKHEDLLTGRSDLDAQWGSEGDLPVTARRAKRENGGLGEDPPGRTMSY